MILVDTSVWAEYLRGTRSPAHLELRRLREDQADLIAIAEPVAMELLMGPTDELAVRRIQRLVESLPVLHLDATLDFPAAAELFRATGRKGRTARNSVDCLIAAVAMRHGATLLHRDADFESIAAVAELDQRYLR